MRFYFGVLASLLFPLVAILYFSLPLVNQLSDRWFNQDLNIRGHLIVEAVRDSLVPLLNSRSKDKVEALFTRMTTDEQLFALGFCDRQGSLLYRTSTLPRINCALTSQEVNAGGRFMDLDGRFVHMASIAMESDGRQLGHLALIHDADFVKRRRNQTQRLLFYIFIVMGLSLTVLASLLLRLRSPKAALPLPPLKHSAGRTSLSPILRPPAVPPKVRWDQANPPLQVALQGFSAPAQMAETLAENGSGIRLSEISPAVSLTEKEQHQLRNGFAREGLYKLCLSPWGRPHFEFEAWAQYQLLNQKFADAVIAKVSSLHPTVVIHDYPFALVPRLLRAELPSATLAMLWYLPWPTPEIAALCPWLGEVVHGLLGSDVLHFQSPFYGTRFMQTVERLLECRVDRHEATITYQGRVTRLAEYSVTALPCAPELFHPDSTAQCRRQVFDRLALPPEIRLGVSIDTLDFCHTIPERLRAVANFLLTHPRMVGKFSFVQLVQLPPGSSLAACDPLIRELTEMVAILNQTFASTSVPALHLFFGEFHKDVIVRYLRSAHLFLATGLSDESYFLAGLFVEVREDEQGVLIVNRGEPPRPEFSQALRVNPLHVEQCAEAIHEAVEMPIAQQRERMRSLRVQRALPHQRLLYQLNTVGKSNAHQREAFLEI